MPPQTAQIIKTFAHPNLARVRPIKGAANNKAELLLTDEIKDKITAAITTEIARQVMETPTAYPHEVRVCWDVAQGTDGINIPELSVSVHQHTLPQGKKRPCAAFHNVMRRISGHLENTGYIHHSVEQFTPEDIGAITHQFMIQDDTPKGNVLFRAIHSVFYETPEKASHENGLDKIHTFTLRSAASVRRMVDAINKSVSADMQITLPERPSLAR